MVTFAEGFDQIQPVLLRRLSGGWLAVSRPGSILSIGVAAESSEEAVDRFKLALTAWQRLWTDSTQTKKTLFQNALDTEQGVKHISSVTITELINEPPDHRTPSTNPSRPL